jgi:hypothetical protein
MSLPEEVKAQIRSTLLATLGSQVRRLVGFLRTTVFFFFFVDDALQCALAELLLFCPLLSCRFSLRSPRSEGHGSSLERREA